MTTIHLTLNISEKRDENAVQAVLQNLMKLHEENPTVVGTPDEHQGNDVSQNNYWIEDFAAHANC
jgi:hypothetical protein